MSEAGTDTERPGECDPDELDECEQDPSDECEQPDQEQPVPVTGGFTDDVHDGPADRDAPEEATVGVAQRLRLQVPNVYTQLTLGEAVNNVDQQGFSYAGFGVQTAGHVYMSAGTGSSAGDGEKENFMMLHGKSGVTAMSPEGSVFVAGRTGVNVGSGGGVTMAGEAGVLIAGGTFKSLATEELGLEFAERSKAHTDPTPPRWAVSQGQLVSSIAVGINGIDTAVAAANSLMRKARRTSLEPSIAPSEGWFAAGFSKLDTVGALASTVGSALDACGHEWPTVKGLKTGVANRASASTVLFGQSGTIVSSPLSVAVYAGSGGAVVGSMGCIDLLSCDSMHAHAGGTVTVSGAGVSVLSSSAAELLSTSDTTIASRKANVRVFGKEIRIGTSKDELPTEAQAETEFALLMGEGTAVAAEDVLRVESGRYIRVGATEQFDLWAQLAQLRATKELNVHAPDILARGDKTLRMSCGHTALLMDADKLSMGWYEKDMDKVDPKLTRELCADLLQLARLDEEALDNEGVGGEKPDSPAKRQAIADTRRFVEGTLAKLKSGGLKNGVVVKRSGIEVAYEGVKFSVTRGKAKLANHLVVAK